MSISLSDRGSSILVVIDFQDRFRTILDRADEVESLLVRTLRGCEIFGVPVILSEHYPRGLGHTTAPVRAAYDALSVPKEVIEKTIFSCAGDDGFNRALERLAPANAEVHLVGIESHVCVLQTAVELLERSFRINLLADVVTSRAAWYTKSGLSQMADAGARISNSESVLFEWCRHKNDPQFKAMNALLKEMPSPGTT